jgi:hypothetical protein
MLEFRKPTHLEERHFIEIVTRFRDRQRAEGKNLAPQLRAELKRFGYYAIKGGLQIELEEPELPMEDEVVFEYHAVIKRVKSGVSEGNQNG